MSTATIIVAALEHVPGPHSTAVALLATSRQAMCSVSPRLSSVCTVDARTLALLAHSPTAWCTADLEIVGLQASALRRVPSVFPQLRSIIVSRIVSGRSREKDDSALAAALSGVCDAAGGSRIRHVVVSYGACVTDSVLRAIAPARGRLESLELLDCSRVGDDGFLALRGGMARLRRFHIGNANFLTDDELATVLAESPLLQSLTVRGARRLTFAFLRRLPEECCEALRELSVEDCAAFSDASAAHLARFAGLERLAVEKCGLLTTLPLALLPGLRALGPCFLSGCDGVTRVVIPRLPNVLSTGDEFLASCKALATVDLSGLVGVVSVGHSFMFNLPALQTVDLACLAHVQDVGSYFMSGSNLTTLDLACLSGVTRIDESFLSQSGMTNLDLSGLRNTTDIGDRFLESPRWLTAIDLTGLSSVTSLGDFFLFGATRLATLECGGLRKVSRIGQGFLRDAQQLSTLDLSGMGAVTSCGPHFLSGCDRLSRVRVSEALLALESVSAAINAIRTTAAVAVC